MTENAGNPGRPSGYLLFLAYPPRQFLGGLDDEFDVLIPREPVAAVLDEGQAHVVAFEGARQA